jgi:formamidopyrimidine-DNA glycosylase
MPELPEVETMASDLRSVVSGKKIKKAEIFAPAMVKDPSAADFSRQIMGAKILNVSRRAKYLIFELNRDRVLLVHPKMTGHFLLRRSAKELPITNYQLPKEPESLKYTRAKFHLDDKSELCFSDIRKFGTLRLLSKKESEEFLNDLGPEPLNLKVDKFISLISSERRKVKQVLMDPAVIAGIGNIYSDEALYLAGIHPETRANQIYEVGLRKLYKAMKLVLERGIKLRGSSINNYRDTAGKKGGYQDVRQVYGRNGESCGRCNASIQKITVAGRSACFCPMCQKNTKARKHESTENPLL